MKQITKEKLENYIGITKKALDKVKINNKYKKQAEVCLDMAQRYFDDAAHFMKKGDFVTAFAAINYAHGWLDAAARLGFFKVNDSELFSV